MQPETRPTLLLKLPEEKVEAERRRQRLLLAPPAVQDDVHELMSKMHRVEEENVDLSQRNAQLVQQVDVLSTHTSSLRHKLKTTQDSLVESDAALASLLKYIDDRNLADKKKEEQQRALMMKKTPDFLGVGGAAATTQKFGGMVPLQAGVIVPPDASSASSFNDGLPIELFVPNNVPPMNRAEYRMCLGAGRHRGTMYCGLRLGGPMIPGSDGQCGPSNGPCCQACASAPVTTGIKLRINRRGNMMFRGQRPYQGAYRYYCGQALSPTTSCGGSGNAEESSGAPCPDCLAGPLSRPCTILNLDGMPFMRGSGSVGHLMMYCGAKKPIAGTDGQCGPTSGRCCHACDIIYVNKVPYSERFDGSDYANI